MRRLLSYILTPLLLCAFFFSCVHKDLCYLNGKQCQLRVVFDWSQTTREAQAMRIFFYSLDDRSQEPIIYDLNGVAGGLVHLPEGQYEVVAYNTDTENILYDSKTKSDGSRELLLTTIPSALAKRLKVPKQSNESEVYETPDWLCRGVLQEPLIITPKECGDETTITITPEEALYYCDYEIRGIRNLQSTMGYPMAVTLSNVSRGLWLRQGHYTTQVAQMLLEARREGDKVIGTCYLFGVSKTGASYLTLHVYTSEGRLSRSFDVTSQIPTLPPRDHKVQVHLVIDTDWELPKPIGGGGGFAPDVEGWDDEERDITL